MTLQGRPRREPPKHKWVIPLVVGIAIAVLVFAAGIVVVTGQSFF